METFSQVPTGKGDADTPRSPDGWWVGLGKERMGEGVGAAQVPSPLLWED